MLTRILPGLLAGVLAAVPAAAETTLRIMSFNVWGGGGNEGKGIEETVAVLKAANADIIGMQETRLEPEDCTAENCAAVGESVAKAIAEALGYHFYDQTQANPALWANAILSRYPIGPASEHDLGVPIDVNGATVWAFNIHHDDEPYQPYQLLGIEYGPAPFIKTEAEAQEWANRTRGPAMDLLFADMAAAEGAAAVGDRGAQLARPPGVPLGAGLLEHAVVEHRVRREQGAGHRVHAPDVGVEQVVGLKARAADLGVEVQPAGSPRVGRCQRPPPVRLARTTAPRGTPRAVTFSTPSSHCRRLQPTYAGTDMTSRTAMSSVYRASRGTGSEVWMRRCAEWTRAQWRGYSYHGSLGRCGPMTGHRDRAWTDTCASVSIAEG